MFVVVLRSGEDIVPTATIFFSRSAHPAARSGLRPRLRKTCALEVQGNRSQGGGSASSAQVVLHRSLSGTRLCGRIAEREDGRSKHVIGLEPGEVAQALVNHQGEEAAPALLADAAEVRR